MGTVDKALSLLNLFTPEQPQWTVEAAAGRLGVPTSTAYRYFRSLSAAGLIVDFAAGRYVVGAGVIELDRLARRTDPLIVAARTTMDTLHDGSPEGCIVLLSRLYRRRVMCVDQRPTGRQDMELSFERGRPMPLYRGSVSKVILAYLPARVIARIFSEDHEEIAKAGLGTTLDAFRETLRTIRRDGMFVSRGEVDPGVIGIAAPIFAPDGDVFGSISLVLREDGEAAYDLKALAAATIAASSNISSILRGEPAETSTAIA